MIEGYCYKILFADGSWYWGTSKYRGISPEKDGYYGSPITHRERWNDPHCKIVLKVFYEEEARIAYETSCILPDLKNSRCLNEHAGRAFSREVCQKGGTRSAEKTTGVPRAPEVKKKISKALKGRKKSQEHVQKLKEVERPTRTSESIAKGVRSRKGYKHSEETKQKIARSNTGRTKTPEEVLKISESLKGFKWYNNGTENIRARQHPGKGWIEGRIFDWSGPRNKGMRWYHKGSQLKMFKEDPGDGWILGRPRDKGKRYYNNGTDQVLAFECPGEGWVLGRLTRK
jgi:hypothetical protein